MCIRDSWPGACPVTSSQPFPTVSRSSIRRSRITSAGLFAEELGWPADTQVIAGVGRLAPEKRWDLLLEAAAPMVNSRLRLALIGAGAEEQRLRDLAAFLHIEDHVSFLGARSDLSDLLAAVDLVASTSPQETFGLAVLEAAVAGRPVVYIRAPAVDEIGDLPGVIKVSEDVDAVRTGLVKGLEIKGRVPRLRRTQHLRHPKGGVEGGRCLRDAVGLEGKKVIVQEESSETARCHRDRRRGMCMESGRCP